MANPLPSDPDAVEIFRQRLTGMPAGHRDGYALGYFSALARVTAAEHSRHCRGCPTCAPLITMLSLVLAYELVNPPPPDLMRGL